MIRKAHAATKDLRAAVREAKRSCRTWARTRLASASGTKCPASWLPGPLAQLIAEFDRFGETLLGKKTYWQMASGQCAVDRPDPDVVVLDVQPGTCAGVDRRR
jgi:hypothetical protein